MSEKDKQIMETFERIIPQLNELDKEILLAFGEGVAMMADRRQESAGQCCA